MSTLQGTATLARLAMRTDRVRLPLWVLGIVALIVVSAASVLGLYGTDEQIATYVALMDANATMVVVNGPGIGFDAPNAGVVFANETMVWAAIAVALMSVFLLVRHTRAEEDSERAELVRSGVVGRHALLLSAALVVAATVVTTSLACLAGMLLVGLDLIGSLAFAAAMVATGLVFTAVAAVAAQLAGTARAALGLALGALGAAYVVRAVGDVGGGAVSWLSPIGWAHRVAPYAGERWVVLLLPILTSAVLAAIAVALFDRRDIGSGLFPQRAGRPRAASGLSSAIGLAVRLQRGSVVGWSIGLAVLGLVYGSVGRDIEQMFVDNPDMEQFIAQMQGASITDSFLAYTLQLGAMMASGFAIASVLRLRGEESTGRAELVLAGPMSRWRWLAMHLAVAVGGTAVVLAASGLGTGVGLAVSIEDPDQIGRMLVASLSLLPATMVLTGLTALLFGALPRAVTLAWSLLAFVVLVGLFADVFELPRWVRSISPFEHVPGLPAGSFDWPPTLTLIAIAIGAVAAAGIGYRRRDMPSV